MTTAGEYKKLLPRAQNYAHTKAFWEAAKRHELVLPRCKKCDYFHFYPREVCPRCFSQDLEWTPVSGKFRVYTFTVVRQAMTPAFQEETPYVNAVVQLAEGPRMMTNIVGCAIEDVKCDMPAEVVFEDVTPEGTLVKFKPA